MDNFEVNINETTDLEIQIINQILINFSDSLNFALLYTIQNETDKKNPLVGNISYELKGSTIGERDISFIELITRLQTFYLRKFSRNASFESQGTMLIIGKNLFRSTFRFSGNFSVNTKSCKNDPSIAKTGRIKLFDFNKIAIGGIREGKNIIILGFKSPSAHRQQHLEASINEFARLIDSKFANEYWHYDRIDRLPNDLEVDQNSFTSEILTAFKKIDETTKGKEKKDTIHLFRYNGYDNRLYYSYLDNSFLELEATHPLMLYFSDNSKQNNLRLSDNQIEYVVENIKKKFKNRKDVRDEAEMVLKNLHDPNYLGKYLANDDGNKKWLLAWVISCIPQEPWTGVAGYTIQTKTIDYSRKTKETRWDPNMLNEAYYYSKLMIYERLIGVGGNHGSMVAYPITDCGQVVGVLFNNNSDKREFKMKYLQNFLGLTYTFKNILSSNRQLEFIQGTFNDLLQGQKNVYPIIPILKNIPKLLNTPLVIVWETNGGTEAEVPAHIYGYRKFYEKYKGIKPDAGLMPMQFSDFEKDDSLYSKLGVDEFRNLREIGSGLIAEGEILSTLSDRFLSEYKKRTIDDVIDDSDVITDDRLVQSIAYSIKSGYIHRYQLKDTEGWMVIYFTQQHSELNEHLEQLKFKMNYIGLVINQTDSLTYLAKNKDIKAHRLRPMNDTINIVLNDAIAFLNGISGDEHSSKKIAAIDHTITLVRQAQLINQYLKEKLGWIDDVHLVALTENQEDVNFINALKRIWKITRLHWLKIGEPGGTYPLYYENADCQVVYHEKGQEFSHWLSSEECIEKLRELKVGVTELNVMLIFENLFSNIFRGNVVSKQLMESHPDRANITIHISSFNDDFFELMICDEGLGMNEETANWIREVVIHITKNPDNDFQSRELIERYETIKNGKTAISYAGTGFGTYIIAKTLRSIVNNYPEYKEQNLKIIETSKRGTKMSFLLPKH